MARTDTGQGRAARQAAEVRLADAQAHVIRPLREMHQENHIGPLLDRLIQQAARKSGET